MRQFTRRLLVPLTILTLLAVPSSLRAQTLPPQPPELATAQQAGINPQALFEMLEKGLRATREDQKEYLTGVVESVAEQKLPVSLVYAAFRYARKRRPSFPYPYFVFALERLKEINDIPPDNDRPDRNE